MVPLLAGGGLTFNSGRIALNYVSAGFFRTLDIDLSTGRDFSDADLDGAPPVAIVNERYAESFGLGPDVLGQRVAFGSVEGAIVGVVADVKYDNVTSPVGPQLFLARRQLASQGAATFYVRGELPPSELMRAVRETVTRVDPIVPITGLRTMQQQIRENLATERFAAGLSSVLALVATALAGIGLYGILAYSVSRRSREIGLRIALGAPQSRIRRSVIRQVAATTLPGLALGVVAAWLLGRAAERLLFGVEAADPIALGVAAFVLVCVALVATYVPARRASTIDPVVVLRYE
jgi:predicted lysophospholipase L1 biosynthesis ABC-type transport system permease subunit